MRVNTKKILAGLLTLLMVLAMMPSLAFAGTPFATLTKDGEKVGDYDDLQTALNAHKSGDAGNYVLTITDKATAYEVGELVIDEYGHKPLTIKAETTGGVTLKYKGDGTHNSLAIFNISGRSDGTGSVTFDGIKFDLSGGAYFALRTMGGGSGEYDKFFPDVVGRYARNISCLNCTFTGDNTAGAKVISADAGTQPGHFLFENCIATDMDSFFSGYGYQTSGGYTDDYGLKVKNCTVTNANRFINNQGTNSSTIVEGCTVSSYNDYSIRTVNNESGSSVIIKDSVITNTCPATKATVGGIVVCRQSGDSVTITNSVLTMPEGFWHVYSKGKTVTVKSGSYRVNKLEGEGKKEIGKLAADVQLTSSDQGYNFLENVAKIGDTEYATLESAMEAAKAGTDKVVTVIGKAKAYSLYGDYTGITVQGSDTGSVTGSFTVQGSGTILKNLCFKNLAFVDDGNIVLSTATADFTGLKIEGCSFEGKGTDSVNCIVLGIGDADYDGIVIKNNTIKGFSGTASSAIVINNSTSAKTGTILVEGNIVTGFGHNGVQLVRPNGTVIIKNNVFERTNSKDILNLNSAAKVIVTGNTFKVAADYSSDNQNVWNSNAGLVVDASKNIFIKGDKVLTDIKDIALMIGANDGKYASYDLSVNSEKEYNGGYLVSKGTTPLSENIADDCSVIAVDATTAGQTIFIIGKKAAATGGKLTAGTYTVNPVAYIAEGYKVEPSGDQDYPYAITKIKSGETEKKEIVVEQKTETTISEEIKDEEEQAVAEAVLEDTKVIGVADALTEKGQDKIIQEAIADDSEVTKEKIQNAKLVDIAITVEAEITAIKTVTTTTEKERIIEFDLTPYAIVTATAKDGTKVSSEIIKVDNDYLAKTAAKAIKVTLGSEFEPKQAIHTREDGVKEVFEKGTKVSYEDKTFTYDKTAQLVTLEITQFSSVQLLADEKYVTVSFDANGGTGSMDSQGVEKGKTIKLPENSFKAPSGKNFKCWSIDGKTYDAGAEITVTKEITVKAVWADAVVTGDFSGLWYYYAIGAFALCGVAFGIYRAGFGRKED